jgi:Zn-finger nucleic acid-binding protein
MTSYRDGERACPSCQAPLEAFHARLVCRSCDGIFVKLADLTEAVEQVTGVSPSFQFADESPGRRACPVCKAAMTTFRLRVRLDSALVETSSAFDRCANHGFWFDVGELAEVFEKTRAQHPGGSGARPHRLAGAHGLTTQPTLLGWDIGQD